MELLVFLRKTKFSVYIILEQYFFGTYNYTHISIQESREILCLDKINFCVIFIKIRRKIMIVYEKQLLTEKVIKISEDDDGRLTLFVDGLPIRFELNELKDFVYAITNAKTALDLKRAQHWTWKVEDLDFS